MIKITLSTGDSSLITLIHLNASGVMKVVDDTNYILSLDSDDHYTMHKIYLNSPRYTTYPLDIVLVLPLDNYLSILPNKAGMRKWIE